MKIFVFLGPSLPLARARTLLPEATFLPPVAVGDLHRLVEREARRGDVIAIIDGVFEQVGAVWHKEVLHALEQGVEVVGTSSMGALRAAELDLYGMRGHGRVYQAFASGELEDDDEVAVAHATAEQGFRSLSLAMVSIRLRLADLCASGVLSEDDAQALVDAAKALHYGARCWPAVLDEAAARGLPAEALAALRAQGARPDAKAEDAASLLELLARGELPPQAGTPEPFRLERTVFWQALVQHNALRGDAGHSDGDLAVLRHVRALDPQRSALLAQAKLLRQAALWGGASSAEQRRAAALRLAREHGLRSNAELAAWRAEQGLDDLAWQRALDLLAREQDLSPAQPHALDGYLLQALRLSGRYGELAAHVQRKQAMLAERGIAKPTLAAAGVDIDALCNWYERHHGPMPARPDEHARELGFESLRDWVGELLIEALGTGEWEAWQAAA